MGPAPFRLTGTRPCVCDQHSRTSLAGTGAAGLAALLRERESLAGKRAGIILSGSNVDRDMFARVLAAA